MSQAMSPKEREAFLAAARVGVLVVASSGEPPLALPMWYDYEPGGLISFITARDSSKAAAIRGAAGRPMRSLGRVPLQVRLGLGSGNGDTDLAQDLEGVSK